MKERIHKRLPEDFVSMVLEAFNEGRICERDACELLGLKRTRLYGLRKRWLRCVIQGKPLYLWERRRSDFHRFPSEVEDWLRRELTYIRREAVTYRGKFNFAFLAEEAEKVFGYAFHRNSLRLFALREGYYHCLPEQKGKVYTRFETAGPGALFQHDSSHHRWIPCLGDRQYLILTEDDYSRRVVGARIVDRETSWEHLEVAREVIEFFGTPLAYYVDQHSIFRFVEHHGVHVRYSRGLDEGAIQFKRALKQLAIGVIYTRKGAAAAKGKVEKRFDYFQRRIPYLCEKYRLRSVQEAQKIVDDAVAYYNHTREHLETREIPVKRWERAIQEGKGKLRPIDPSQDLEAIFSLQYPRVVKKDGTISFQGRLWKIGRFSGQEVTVCLIPEKKVIVLKDNRRIYEEHL
jgi:transposase InsO family protein